MAGGGARQIEPDRRAGQVERDERQAREERRPVGRADRIVEGGEQSEEDRRLARAAFVVELDRGGDGGLELLAIPGDVAPDRQPRQREEAARRIRLGDGEPRTRLGGTAGIITMEDLLEEIFGEIKDEYDTEEFEERKLSADEFIFSGRLELDYLNEKYGLELPQNGSETLSGYIINQHETIPHLKDRIIIGDYEFEILNVSDTRIEMVRLKVLK